MGWNCMECGGLLKPKEKMTVESKAGNLSVDRNICPNCEAEFITVFRYHGDGNNYLGQVKIWPDTESRADEQALEAYKETMDQAERAYRKAIAQDRAQALEVYRETAARAWKTYKEAKEGEQ